MQRDNFRTPHQQLNRLAIFTWVCSKLHPQQELLMPIPKKRKKKRKKKLHYLSGQRPGCLLDFGTDLMFPVSPIPKSNPNLVCFVDFKLHGFAFHPPNPKKKGLDYTQNFDNPLFLIPKNLLSLPLPPSIN